MGAIVSSVPIWTRAAEPDDASSVTALVVAARTGDRTAFERLYELHARMVHGILLARVAREDVDDLQQDVFLHAWRRLGDVRTPAAFGSWLAQIARRRAIDSLRLGRDAPFVDEDTTDGTARRARTDACADSATTTIEAKQALEAIQRLPDAYRETLMLRLVEGMTGPEIAARTGLTPGSVRVNLHRGMARLRDVLSRGERDV
jgi:RNA polymerase sigma-70 factor (ECF subfamily)